MSRVNCHHHGDELWPPKMKLQEEKQTGLCAKEEVSSIAGFLGIGLLRPYSMIDNIIIDS